MSLIYIVRDWGEAVKMDGEMIKFIIANYVRNYTKAESKGKFSNDVMLELMRWIQKHDGIEVLCPENKFHSKIYADLGDTGGISLYWQVNKNTYLFSIDPKLGIKDRTIKDMSWRVTFSYGNKDKFHHNWSWNMEEENAAIGDWREMGYLDDDEEHIMWLQILFDDHVHLTMEDDTFCDAKINEFMF